MNSRLCAEPPSRNVTFRSCHIKDLQGLIQARIRLPGLGFLKKSKTRVRLSVCFLSGLLEGGGARGLDWVTEKGSEMHEWREVSAGGSPSGRLIYPHV